VVTAKEEFHARIERLHGRLQAAMRSGIQRRRNVLHVLTSRRGLAGWHVRVAMQGRHVSELTHGLRRATTALIARRAREHQARAARLEARDVRRGLAAIRSRLAAADTRLHVTARRVHERTAARFTALAGRLEMLSPLAVLARGYAVCWNEDRTAIIRQASAVAPGDVVRVTLHEGEIDCEVRSAHGRDNQGL
jgi:exodeoxyribonuclease VII large subunit